MAAAIGTGVVLRTGNDVTSLSKIKPLPIGLDFHTLAEKSVRGVVHRGVAAGSAGMQQYTLDAVARSLPPNKDRPLRCYASKWRPLSSTALRGPHVIVEAGARVDPRTRAVDVLGKCPFVTMESDEVDRTEAWRRHGAHAFVISPPGHGLDCHRTWEALALGCIPIILAPAVSVQTCASVKDAAAITEWQNPLFVSSNGEPLPVVTVSRWEDVTESALRRWHARFAGEFARKNNVDEVLSMSKWVARLRSH